jgi:hypothetical protein
MKADAFVNLMDLCARMNRLDIMIQRCRNIETDSATWNLTEEERRTLLKSVAEALDRINDNGAFKVTQAFLNQYNKQ